MASQNVKLPDLGEGVTEGELVRWLVKIGDFGLAKRSATRDSCTFSVKLAETERSGTSLNTGVKGTVEYMAPELFSGTAVSVQSDIYSFGITAFELLSGGTLPFGSQMMAGLITEKQTQDLIELPEGGAYVPPSLREVVKNAKRGDPQDHDWSVIEMRKELQQALPEIIADASPESSPSPRKSRPKGRLGIHAEIRTLGGKMEQDGAKRSHFREQFALYILMSGIALVAVSIMLVLAAATKHVPAHAIRPADRPERISPEVLSGVEIYSARP